MQRTIVVVKCPQCVKAKLMPLELGDILLDRCETCAGLWFDYGELEAVIGIETASTIEALGEHDDGLEEMGGHCPRCNLRMIPASVSHDPQRKVPVDRCPSCMGLWLSRNQLRVIENSRLILSVRELFVGEELDQKIVSELDDASREKIEKALKLLQSHPHRTALLAYIERTSGGRERNQWELTKK